MFAPGGAACQRFWGVTEESHGGERVYLEERRRLQQLVNQVELFLELVLKRKRKTTVQFYPLFFSDTLDENRQVVWELRISSANHERFLLLSLSKHVELKAQPLHQHHHIASW